MATIPVVEMPAGGRAAPPPGPRADVGVLLVHGIGDHVEGETLTSFGEPLVDWLREWLRGRGGEHARGELTVTEARLRATRNEAESPAYALARVRGAARAGDADAEERWLLCEAWWGGTVQAPPSMKLLAWMFTRGPLLVYWHFYLGLTRLAGDEPGWRHLAFSLFAFLIAATCQALVAVAMLLYLVPIGPWRRGVVATVRALTLTLGDSYVLLEQDIQHGALVERVRRSLGWLCERCDRAVVIAHSQGGAIAHEALRTAAPANVAIFASVGSGLEKLEFLRHVRVARDGLAAASLLFPVTLGGGLLLGHGLSAAGERWQVVAGGLLLVGAMVVIAALIDALNGYRTRLSAQVTQLSLPCVPRRGWVDLHATNDVVPMGRGSILSRERFVVRCETSNERSFVHDHVSYFESRHDCLARLWQVIAHASALRLFAPGDRGRLRRYLRVHRHYVRLLALNRMATLLAAVLLAFQLRNQLVTFGRSVLGGVDGTPLGDVLKPLSTLAAAVAWLVKRIWDTSVVDAATIADALFGALVLFGTLALWWVGFRSFWRWRSTVRWRHACRGRDVLDSRGRYVTHVTACSVFAAVGALPFLVALVLAIVPEALGANALREAISVILALFFVAVALLYAIGGPWVARAGWSDADTPLPVRLATPLFIALFAVLFAFIALWLWPQLPGQDLMYAAVWSIAAVAWQVFACTLPRVRNAWKVLVALVPPASVVAAWRFVPALAWPADAVATYVGAMVAVVAPALAATYRVELVAELGAMLAAARRAWAARPWRASGP